MTNRVAFLTASVLLFAGLGADFASAQLFSTITSQTVNPAATTTSLGSSATTSTFGQSIILTATLIPGTATGTVTFYDGGSVLGVGTISGSTATFATRLLGAGAHNLKALYRGSPNYLPSTSSPLLVQTVNSTAQNGFATGVVYGTGTGGSWGIVTADFNGDGKTDVAMANYNSTFVSVFLGNGNGTLGPVANISVASNPIGLAVGDFNGDGKADIAVAGYDSNTVSILLGNGAGGFAAAVNYTAGLGSLPEGIAIGDFNGDGIADLAVGNNGSSNVSVLLGAGNGTFGPGTLYAVGPHPSTPVAQDLNGDGFTDLVVTSFDNHGVYVLLGRGDGTFGTSAFFDTGGTQAYFVAAGDFNRDGVVDLAVSNAGTANVGVILGVGNGTFGSPTLYSVGTTPESLTVGDFNGDGKLDLVVGNDGNSNATVLLGNGTGGFAALGNFSSPTGTGARGVAAGDFNGDGVSDFVIANPGTGTVSMLIGLAKTTTALTSSVNPSAYNGSTTLTATVTPSTATGTVTFFDGAFSLGSPALSTGAAALSVSNLLVGPHTLTAVYNGDATRAVSTSNVVSQTVNKATTTTGLGSSPNPAAPGATVTLIATIVPASATGTVQFKDGATVLGIGTLAGGAAQLTTSALTSGSHSLTAVYSGDANYLTSTSSIVTQIIKTVSATALSSSLNPATTGQSVTFSATLTPSTATGNVTFTDNGISIGTGALNGSGIATLTTSSLTAGPRSIVASYPGDANNVASTSGTLTQLVNIVTTTTLSASPAISSVFGSAVTLTATVTPGTPNGTVTFYDGATVLGTGTLAGGTTSLATRLLGTGSHKLRAFYKGTATATEVIDFTSSSAGTSISTTLSGLGANGDFRADYVGFGDVGVIQVNAGNNVYGDSVLNNASGAGINLRRTDNSPFSVTQFTLLGNGSTMSFAGANYSAPGTYSLSNVNNVSSILVNINGAGATPFQVDNIYVTARPASSTNFLASSSTLAYSVNSRVQNGFNDGALYSTGLSPLGSAVGDFNADGKADFVVANYGDNTVSVFLGTGAGALGAATNFPVGTKPFSVAAADFNNDGKADIAVANLLSNSISILIGNGAGGFAAAVDYTAGVGANPDYIVAADFNGDGLVDLATANFNSSDVSVLFGSGTGTFGPGTLYSVGTNPVGLVAGDFNNDGKTDLATANQTSNNVSVLLGTGNGPFSGAANFAAGGTGQEGLATADFDGDGNLDLAVTNAASNSVTLLAGNGTGAFGSPVVIASTPTPFSATPGDFNGDGKVDLALSTDTSSEVVILFGNGAGSFAAPYAFIDASIAGSYSVVVADLNGDGISDIVISDFYGDSANVFLGLVNTTTALTSSVNPSVFGGSTTLTATVTPSTATGTVTFLDFSEITLGTATLTNGVATLSVSSLALGSHPLTAFYGGDAANATSVSSPAVTHVVNRAPTLTSLGSSANPSTFGQGIILTATVNSLTATGNVTFKDGAATLGTTPLGAGTGTATFSLATITAGPHSLTAVYSGDANYLTSTSSVFSQTVNKAPVSVGGLSPLLLSYMQSPGTCETPGPCTTSPGVAGTNMTAGYSGAVGRAVGYDPNAIWSAAFGGLGSAIFDVSMVASSSGPLASVSFDIFNNDCQAGGPVIPGCVPVTWQVSTNINGGAYSVVGAVPSGPPVGACSGCSPTLLHAVVPLNRTYQPGDTIGLRVANQSQSGLGAGQYIFYNVNFIGALPATITAAPNPSILGQAVTLQAAVTPPTATGTVTFKDGAATLGTGTLANGLASFSTAALTPGSHTLTGVYSGDSSYLAGTSQPLTQVVRHVIFSDNFNTTPSGLWGNDVGNWAANGGVYDAGSPSVNPNAHSLLPFVMPDFTFHVNTSLVGDGGVWLHAANNGGVGAGVNGILLVIRPAASDLYFHDVQNGIYGNALSRVSIPAAAHGFDIVVTGNTYSVFMDGAASPVTTLVNSSWSSGQVGFYESSHLGFDNVLLYDFTTPTSLGLVTSLTPTVFGQSATLTATVKPTSATGTVAFQEGGQTLGTGSLSNGVATFNTAPLSAGSHTVTAVYTGDPNFFTSTSSPVVQVVNQAASTTALLSSLNPSAFGQSVTLTATISPSTASGSVTFLDGTNVLGVASLTGGVTSLSLATLGVGAHSLTAVYSGNTNFATSTSSTLTQTVGKATTTTTLTSSPNPSANGQAVTLSATVAPATATGTVTFKDGSTVLGTGTLTNGIATFSLSTLLPGSHGLTGVYGGDASYLTSTSSSAGPALTFTSAVPNTIRDTAGNGTGFTTRLPGTGGSIAVNDPNFTLNPGSGTLTWRTVASDLNGQGNLGAGDYMGFPLSAAGVTLNQDFTVSATFRNLQFGLNYDQIGIFVGTSSTIAFRAGFVFIGGAYAFTVQTPNGLDSGGVLNSALAPAPGEDVIFTMSRTAGVWAFNIQNLTTPSKSGSVGVTQPTYLNGVSGLIAGLFASNAGNGTIRTETVSAFSVGSSQGVVQVVNPTPTTTALTSSNSLTPLGLPVTLTATIAPSTATGTVTFKDGATTIGTGAVSTNGIATLVISTLTLGTHSITASYGGDTIFAPSVSGAFQQSINQIKTSTTLTSSPNPSSVGQQVTLTATVSPSTATGTVSFRSDGASLGTGTLSGGVATFNTGQIPAGTHNLTAVYGGDVSDLASTSATVAQSVSYPPISITTGSVPGGALGQPYGPVTFAATGGSGFYTWSGSGLPAGLTLSGSGTLSGTPTAGFNGSITATANDSGAGLTASRSYSLTVTVPTLTINGPGSLGSVLAGGAVSGTYTVGGGTPPFTWNISGGAGVAVDSGGHVTGNLGRPGNFAFTLTVTDSSNNSASLALTASAFGITTSGLPPASTTVDYSATINAAGGTPPYSFSGSGLPPGLTFSNGTISGRATTPGSSTIAVTATDSRGLAASASFSLSVTGNAALRIFSSSLSDATVGQPYSQTLSATGGATPYTWSQSTGSLPDGMSLNSSGTLSGRPTTPGAYQFGIQVTDSSGGQAVGAVSVQVQAAPLQITSGGTLPDGIVGVEFPAQVLGASGGIPPYTFTARGALPAGLALSGGQIAGTPSGTPGSSTFTIVVTDSATPAATGLLGTSVNIRPSSPDLTLSSGSLRFSLVSGAAAPPSAANVIVGSSAVAQVLGFSVSSSVPWMTATGSGSTPGSVSVALNGAALALAPAGSPFSGIVTVTCTSDICKGKSQQINVSLTITILPPQLSVDTALLSFVALSSNPSPSGGTLALSNSGGGTLTITSVTAGAPWLSIGTVPSQIPAGPGVSVDITASPAGLAPGYYRGSVNVASSAGNGSVPVTFLISGSSTMTLGPAGTQFSMPQGGVLGNGRGSFGVAVQGSGSVNYTSAVSSGAPWLVLNGGSGTASGASPGTVNFSIDGAQAAALPQGAYYGTVRVTASGIVNSPQDFQVILNISPPATSVVPDPQPAGLVFLTSGTGALPPQTVQVFASSRTAIPFQASASTESGSWLSISPTTGSTSAASPGQVSATVSASGLRPGVYRGSISFAFSGASVRIVNVTLIVQAVATEPSPVTGLRPEISARPAATCASGTLVPTQTGLVNNFSAPASWPTPLAIKLFDTCGNAVGNGQIVATFSNGDPPLILSSLNPAGGLYSGTWTPRKASAQITITAQASATGYPSATVKLAGQVSPNTAPVLAANGTQDVFHPQVGGGLGPGNIVQIYGSGLSSQTVSPTELPLPTTLSGSTVLIGGVESPLFYVSPGQINAQIPFELTAGNQYQVIVSANGALTTPQPIQLTSAAPSILEFRSGAVVAQHLDGSLISDTAPGTPGEHVVIYLSGLGATDIKVPSGAPSPSNPPAKVLDVPVVTLNDTAVKLEFAGLAPSLVGLYQVNFQIPQDLPAANYALVITQSGVSSNRTVLPVKP